MAVAESAVADSDVGGRDVGVTALDEAGLDGDVVVARVDGGVSR